MQSLIQAYIHADPFGRFIFYTLFMLAIVSWSVLAYKVWIIYQLRQSYKKHEALLKTKNILETTLTHKPGPHPFLQLHDVLKKNVLQILQKNRSSEDEATFLSTADLALIKSQLESTITKQMKILQRNLFILPTVMTLAPFLGLLGTVWGILIIFSGLQIHSVSGPSGAILSGFSMAMATTILGLLIAVPSLIAYNYLKHSIAELSKDMENFSQGMLSVIETQYRKVDA